jgi:type II secretory pathway component GspD/PulD (secretin)
MEGHAQRPDTRPIEDPAEKPKISLAKQGASTHEATMIDWQRSDGLSVAAALAPFEGSWSVGDGSLVLPFGSHALAVAATVDAGSGVVVASPSVVVASGERAELVAGDQVPIESSVISETGVVTQAVIYRSTGVVLTVDVDALADGSIRARFELELTVPDGAQPPTFRTRTVATSLRVTDGQSVVVGGLSLEGMQRSRSGLPVLSLVGLGGVRSRSSSAGELVAVVTLRLVRPVGR